MEHASWNCQYGPVLNERTWDFKVDKSFRAGKIALLEKSEKTVAISMNKLNFARTEVKKVDASSLSRGTSAQDRNVFNGGTSSLRKSDLIHQAAILQKLRREVRQLNDEMKLHLDAARNGSATLSGANTVSPDLLVQFMAVVDDTRTDERVLQVSFRRSLEQACVTSRCFTGSIRPYYP